MGLSVLVRCLSWATFVLLGVLHLSGFLGLGLRVELCMHVV